MGDGSLLTVVIGVLLALIGLLQLFIKRVDKGADDTEEMRAEIYKYKEQLITLQHRYRKLVRQYKRLLKAYKKRTRTVDRLLRLYREEVEKNNTS